MRPLKPFALRLGGLIAAVLGSVFFGAQAEIAPTAPAKTQLPDLQSTRTPPPTESVVTRNAKADDTAPHLPPVFPFAGLSTAETPPLAAAFYLAHATRAPKR